MRARIGSAARDWQRFNHQHWKPGIAGKCYIIEGNIGFRWIFLVNCDESDELQCLQLGNVFGTRKPIIALPYRKENQ